MEAIPALEDGRVFQGHALGAFGDVSGAVVSGAGIPLLTVPRGAEGAPGRHDPRGAFDSLRAIIAS